MNKTKIGFIGAGNMGFALLSGLASSPMAKDISLFAYDKMPEKLEKLAELGVTAVSSEQELIDSSDFIFLAVKPQALGATLKACSFEACPGKTIISICAGIAEDFIRFLTTPAQPVILVMPNTPLLLGEGASALSKTPEVSEENFAFIMKVFSLCGIAREIPLNKMKEIIAINGSSPAFIYLFAKAFIDYAAEQDIPAEAAQALFAQSLIGSAKMITDSGNSIDRLIEMVSSPGGTTLAGLKELYDGSFVELTKKCCSACTNRAYELSRQ